MQIFSLAPVESPGSASHPQQHPATPAFSALSALSALPVITEQTALFLDFDGTLVDIASQPGLVLIPADLVGLLGRLARGLGGALAIVSGRGLADIDHFLSPLLLPVAAEHGAVQRSEGASACFTAAPDLTGVARVALALAREHPGLHVEVKSAAVALHYRHAPELEAVCLEAMAEACKRTAGVDLMRGKFVFEIKPSGVSKGSALQTFMRQPPFAGRVPLFAGDDTTDEAGFAAAQAMGGYGLKVGDGPTAALHRCASPALLRDWLQTAADGLTA